MTFMTHPLRRSSLFVAVALLAACGGTQPTSEAAPTAPPVAPPTVTVTPVTPTAPVTPAAPVVVAPVVTAPAAVPAPHQTIGGGTIDQPAVGPAPTISQAGDGFVLVKNWNFGTEADSTVTDIASLSDHFQYHDQFGTITNQYGAKIVAPNEATALKGRQPIEGADTGGKPVREFTGDALKTYLVPLNGASECLPTKRNVGCGSFQAKWKLPNGGSRLGQDVLWETRVRYHVIPYFWFAIWTSGNKWSKGAEIDVVEGFGYDNGGGYTNFDGRFWHVGIVGGREDEPYKSWESSMKKFGVTRWDPAAYHVWSMLYKADNSIAVYMDGLPVQSGFSHWTLGTGEKAEPIDMSFLFDASWGHIGIPSVNKPLPASAFAAASYEWDYSRVYLRTAAAPAR